MDLRTSNGTLCLPIHIAYVVNKQVRIWPLLMSGMLDFGVVAM